jgi:hypothetical protein
MRDTHLSDARCADLVLGLLAPDERAGDLAHAERCAPCAERLRAHVAATFRARADRPGAILAIPRAGRARGWRSLGAGGAAAAALLLAMLLWPRSTGHAPVPGLTTRWLATPTEGTLMRAGESIDPRLTAGLDAYAKRDLATAERELKAARASEGAEQARRLYLAHVLLLRHDAHGALALLRSLDYIELPGAVSRDAVRLLADALRAEGSVDSADSLEQALRRSPDWAPIVP